MNDKFVRLRQKAENFVHTNPVDVSRLSDDDIKNMVHDLEVHQVELEMQNDELHRVNVKMQEAQKKYEDLFEFAPVGYVILNSDLKIDTFNLAFSNMTGNSRQNIINRDFTDFIHPDSQDTFHIAARRFTKAANEKQTLELRFIAPDRDEMWATADIISRNNNQSYWISVSDISFRVAFERQLIDARETAEAANRAKSEFLANMSHELRTPLNAIIGFAQLLSRTRDMNPDHLDKLEIINRSGEHLLSLINDVLDMSKIEAGGMSLELSSFDLHGTLDGIEEMIHAQVEKKHLEFTVERTPDLPRNIKTDRNKLRQVLINLLGNAVKYTDKGRVILRIGIETDNGKGGPSRLRFEIHDSGPGISREDMERVFDPFVRSSGIHQGEKGTGLGLSISNRLVRLMGGRLDVQSEVGVGSVFKFDIRIEPPDMSQLKISSNTRHIIGLAPGQPVPRVLVVEDNEPNRILLADLLKSAGFDVRAAVNGEEALEQCKRFLPHLIWMDMRMPVMDGYEATRRIKSGGFSEVKTIALTAQVFEEDRNRILDAGCDDLVRKPFKQSEIFETMEKHLDVSYIYEDADNPETETSKKADTWKDLSCMPEILATLPDEWYENMKSAIVLVDFETTRNLIKQIRWQNPLLAEKLMELVEQYRFDTLQTLFKKANNCKYLSPGDLATLSPELKGGLKKAVSTGSLDQIADVLEKIHTVDPVLADTLKKLTHEFQYLKILALIEAG